jgi:hypothetical protein
MKTILFTTTLSAIVALALALPLPAHAGPGHDHGESAPAVSGTALPRFAAESELFELVGVLNGRRLALYLDRSADNTPVLGAKIEIEIAGAKFVAQKHSEQADAYEVLLPADPKPELLPVTATVTAGADIDLLAGELDLHDHSHNHKSAHLHSWRKVAFWGAGGVAGLGVLVMLGRLAIARQRRGGVAA